MNHVPLAACSFSEVATGASAAFAAMAASLVVVIREIRRTPDSIIPEKGESADG